MVTPKTAPCPTCRREAPWADNPHRPFCSERCRLADFGNWAGERYRIVGPAVEPEPAEEGDDSES